MAAIVPPACAAQRPIASARSLMRAKPSSIESIPEATIAAYSPSECPATAEKGTPASLRQANAASDAAMMAGWATSVAASSPAEPSRQRASRSYPRTAEAVSKTARAAWERSVSSAAMPGFWEPCPENRSAFIKNVLSEVKFAAGKTCGKRNLQSAQFEQFFGLICYFFVKFPLRILQSRPRKRFAC